MCLDSTFTHHPGCSGLRKSPHSNRERLNAGMSAKTSDQRLQGGFSGINWRDRSDPSRTVLAAEADVMNGDERADLGVEVIGFLI